MSDATQRLRSDSAVLQAVFEAAVDAIVVSDAKGRITRANAAAGALFGYETDAMIGQSVNILMPPKYAREHDGYMTHYLDTGERRIIGIGRDVEGQRSDGTVFPLHLSVGRAVLGDEPIFIAILHDLSVRRAAQAALSRSQRLDAVGQMTGGIAHDFNNLLTIIIGNLELLEIRSGHRFGDLVGDALEAAELGADLTRRLLTFARKSELAPQVLSLPDACNEVLSILSRTLGERYRIESRHSPDQPPVSVDPAQLQTALLNLALNARDAMPDGGRLLIETERVIVDDTYIAQETDITPGRYVRLSVSDTGIGMDETAQKQAFEPFFSTKPVGQGTGLGLSMVYGFVRQSGGHVTLYSEVGRGTTFALYFPSVEADAPEDQPVEVGRLPRGRGEVILVVEDDAKVRRLSLARLKDLGYHPIQAADAEAALTLMEELGRVDLLFTDIVMPGELNGFELARVVTERYPQTKILLTSGYASDVMMPSLADRAFPLLRKPYRLFDLAQRLRDLLRGEQG